MGFLGSLFGGGGGGNFQAGSTQIDKPTTVGQANTAYDQTQQGIAQQQAFVNALNGQNGIQNQSGVFNQLQGVANGTGPNPAQAALNQATGQNVANQAALMASQRGAGANAGLLARQAAQQGANIQQQVAGQGATLQAQQQLGALGQLGGIAGQQVGQQAGAIQGLNAATQGQQQNLLSGINAQNQAGVQMQSNINSANAGVQSEVAKGQQGILGGVLGGAGSALGLKFASGGEVKMADGGMTMPNFSAVQPLQMPDLSQVAALTPLAAPAIQPPAGGPSSAVGRHFAAMGSSNPNQPSPGIAIGTPIGSAIGTAIKSLFGSNAPTTTRTSGSDQINPNAVDTQGASTMTAAHGGKVPALLSPGEKYLSPKESKEVAKGDKDVKTSGKTVPGNAKVKGDSEENDIVHAELEAGGFVIPRSIMQSENPDKNAAAFIRAHMSRRDALSKK